MKFLLLIVSLMLTACCPKPEDVTAAGLRCADKYKPDTNPFHECLRLDGGDRMLRAYRDCGECRVKVNGFALSQEAENAWSRVRGGSGPANLTVERMTVEEERTLTERCEHANTHPTGKPVSIYRKKTGPSGKVLLLSFDSSYELIGCRKSSSEGSL